VALGWPSPTFAKHDWIGYVLTPEESVPGARRDERKGRHQRADLRIGEFDVGEGTARLAARRSFCDEILVLFFIVIYFFVF